MVLSERRGNPMRAAVILMLVTAVLGTSACSRVGGMFSRGARPDVALPYRGALKQENDGTLVVTVRAGGASLEQARESARFEVTRHCISRVGSSAADWEMNPATGDWAHAYDASGNMILRARCRA